MTDHGRPSWYSWVVVVVVPLMASVAVLVISLRINEQSIQREREARRASEQAFCGIVTLLDDSYRRTPPTTPAGRDLAAAVRDARAGYRCPPPQ
jgi:hypothetical protein